MYLLPAKGLKLLFWVLTSLNNRKSFCSNVFAHSEKLLFHDMMVFPLSCRSRFRCKCLKTKAEMFISCLKFFFCFIFPQARELMHLILQGYCVLFFKNPKLTILSIHPSTFYSSFLCTLGPGGLLESLPAVIDWRQRDTLEQVASSSQGLFERHTNIQRPGTAHSSQSTPLVCCSDTEEE